MFSLLLGRYSFGEVTCGLEIDHARSCQVFVGILGKPDVIRVCTASMNVALRYTSAFP